MQQLAVDLIEEDPDFKTISVTVTHRKPISESYDVLTGEKYWFNSDTEMVAIIGPYSNTQENAQDIQIGDMKLITAALTLQQPVEPMNDSIILENGTTFVVLRVETDAANATYTMQLRQEYGNNYN